MPQGRNDEIDSDALAYGFGELGLAGSEQTRFMGVSNSYYYAPACWRPSTIGRRAGRPDGGNCREPGWAKHSAPVCTAGVCFPAPPSRQGGLSEETGGTPEPARVRRALAPRYLAACLGSYAATQFVMPHGCDRTQGELCKSEHVGARFNFWHRAHAAGSRRTI